MKLVSMKLDAAEREKSYGPETVAVEGPSYPWGLSVTLDNEVLEKLGIDLPEIGKSYLLHARVDVTRVSADQQTEGGKTRKHRSASLQITDLAIETDTGEGASAADVLYGGSS